MLTIEQLKAEAWHKSRYDRYSNAEHAFKEAFDLGVQAADQWKVPALTLPEKEGRYIVTYLRRGDGRHLVRPARFESGRFWRMESPSPYCDVLAWREFPLPYHPEEEEGGNCSETCSICGEPMVDQMDHPFCLATMQGKDWV